MPVVTLGTADLLGLVSALLALLVASQVMGGLFQRLHQPRVIGEIIGGVLLGPMGLGALWPGAYQALFGSSLQQQHILAFAFWLGLVLLMFCSGEEAGPIGSGAGSPREWRIVAWLSVTGILIPMGVGLALGRWWDFGPFFGSAATPLKFALVLAMAITVTAIPVISKIFMDLGIHGTPFARVILGVAFLEDLALWIVLSVMLGIGHGAGQSGGILALGVAVTVAFCGASLWGGPKGYDTFSASRFNPLKSAGEATGPVFALLAMVAFALAIGVNPIFAAFLAGDMVGRARRVTVETRQAIRRFAFGLFVPVFFASVGLKLDLRFDFPWSTFFGLLAVALIVKTVAALLGGQLAGQGLAASFHLAVALNARGALGIVLATVALEAHLITTAFYTVLVLLALVTSQFSGWWLHRIKLRSPGQFELVGIPTGLKPSQPPVLSA